MHYGATRASLTRTHKRITTMLGNTAYLLTEVNRLTMHGNFPNRSPVQVFGVIRGTAAVGLLQALSTTSRYSTTVCGVV